ncbi:MAG: hypothetical protein J5865_05185 [Lachnospiraceae bacterium]|nr:hypothetical protein [Lachnospiraceae bacterium]
MKKGVKLYNLIFPIYLIYLFPTLLWLLLIPFDFAVDSLVLILAGRAKKLDWKAVWKASIVRVVLFGFLADLAGALITMVLHYGLLERRLDIYVWPDVMWITIPGVILAGVLIYFLNLKFSFKKTDLEPAQIRFLSLMLALFTAPYTMMLPIYIG